MRQRPTGSSSPSCSTVSTARSNATQAILIHLAAFASRAGDAEHGRELGTTPSAAAAAAVAEHAGALGAVVPWSSEIVAVQRILDEDCSPTTWLTNTTRY